MNDKTSILILCTGNSCRSQMAKGILSNLDTNLIVESAGTFPSEKVHPFAIAVMNEIGIDISSYKPTNVNQFINQSFNYVVTVCDDANDNCPIFLGKVANRLHIGFRDPAKAVGTEEEILSFFRIIRDRIIVDFSKFYKQIIGN